MHESALARDLWDRIRVHAESNKLAAITAVTVVVGEHAGVDKEFLRHSLQDHCFPGTSAAGATLKLVDEQVALSCSRCGTRRIGDMDETLSCGKCGSRDFEIIAGKDVYVREIEGE